MYSNLDELLSTTSENNSTVDISSMLPMSLGSTAVDVGDSSQTVLQAARKHSTQAHTQCFTAQLQNDRKGHGNSDCNGVRTGDRIPAATPLGSEGVSSFFSNTAVVAANLAESDSELCLPSVPTTAPQSPPPSRQRISHKAAVGPLVEADVKSSSTLEQQQFQRQIGLPSDPSTYQRGAALNSGLLVFTGTSSSNNIPADVVMGQRAQWVYPTYNVHPVLRRSAHPLFQRDIPTKIGRQPMANSQYLHNNKNNPGTSDSSFLPLTGPRGEWNAGASTSMWPNQTSGISPTAANTDSPSRRGFRFPQQTLLPSLSRNGTSGGAGTEGASAPTTTINTLVKLPSTPHSTGDKTSDNRKQLQDLLLFQPQDAEEEKGTTNLPEVLMTTPSHGLKSTAIAPVHPSNPLPNSTAVHAGGSTTQSLSAAISRYTEPTTPPFNTSFSSPSFRLQGSPYMTYAKTWAAPQQQQQLQQSPRSAQRVSLTSFQSGQSAQPFNSPRSVASTQNPIHHEHQQQYHMHCASALRVAVPPSTPVTPSTRVRPAAHLYSRRDIRRGRWLIDIAREECEARAALEERESYEAIRTLPASCRVWLSYIDPAFNSEYNTLGYYFLARVVSHEKAAPSSGKFILHYPNEDHAGLLSGDESDVDATPTASGTDKSCELHGVLKKFANKRALEKEKMAVEAATTHPAFMAAWRRLVLLEEVCREDIVKRENTIFRENLYFPYAYEHRVMTVGTLPLERFLRRWIGFFRARKIVHARQRARLCATESDARAGLIASSHCLAARLLCMVTATEEEERYYRTQLELLHAQNAAWTGVVLLKLQEHVELFSLLFGGTMRHTRVCGRVQGATLFRSLVLREEATRDSIISEEAEEWRRVPITMELRWSVVSAEPQARARLVGAEATRRAELTQVIYALTVHYTRRDVELQELDERHDWGGLWAQLLARDARTSTEEL